MGNFYRNIIILFFFVLLRSNFGIAQLTLYSEDFEDDYQEGCGYGSCSDDDNGNWYLTQVGTPDNNGSQSSWDDVAFFDGAAVIPSTDLAFRWNDNNDGNSSNREDWYSKSISGAYSNISISIPYWIGSSGTGSIWAYYILDGGAPVLIGSDLANSNTSGTFTVSGLTSTTSIQITVQVVNSNVNAAYVKIDNVSITADCPASYSGTYQVGPTGTWSTLTTALMVLKSCMVDDVILELQSTYSDASETYPLDFSGLPTSSTVTLTIRPKSDVVSTIVLDGSASTIFDFDATNYVTIDGRPGGSGSTSRLTLENTTAAAASKRAIIIQNNSSNNTITYCTLLSDNSSTTNSTAGVVFFGSGASGNSSNTISYCTLTYATTATACLIVSYNASASTANTSNIISNNTLTDFTNHGIWCDTKSTSFTISSNQIYQTAAAYSTSTAGSYLIYVTAGTGYTINGNYIGGAGVNCNSADYFTVNANGSIYAINFGGTGAGTNSIYSNTIKYIKSNSTTATSVAVGIYVNNATSTTLNIYNNTIAYIKAGSSSTAAVHYSAGMLSTGTCSTVTLSVYNNTVNYIENAMGGSSSAYLYGIDFSSSTSATTNYYYNNYVNIDYGASAARIYGVSTGASAVIYNNTIYVYSGSQQTYDRYCLRIKGGVNNTVQNNLFINASSGTSGNTKYSSDIYVNGSGGTQTHSYNYYQFTGTYSSSVNNNGTATSWTGETGGQTNTDVTLDTDGRATPSASRIADLGTDLRASSPAITDDIIGESRSDASPWIGCYEGNASFYWVGGSGNWSSYASHWATTSGGATFQTAVPTSSDKVIFDANSGAGTCTIDAAAYCSNFTSTGFTGTIAGSFTLDIHGDLTVGSSSTWSHTGTTTFKSTSTGKTITPNSVTLACPITFNGSGGGWTLAGDLTCSSTSAFTLTAGTLNLSSYTLSIAGDFTKATAFTFTPGTGTVSFTGNSSAINGTTAAPSFYNIVVSKTAGQTLSTGGSVTSLTCTNNFTETTGNFTAPTNMTVSGNLTVSAGTFTAPSGTLTLVGDFTSNSTYTANTGTFKFNGTSAQTLSGSTNPNFYNLTIDNSSTGVSLGLNTTMTNTLTLTSGLLKTVSYTLTLGADGANATIPIGSSSSYIVAYNNAGTIGYVKQFVNSVTTYNFPIGDLTNYTPLTFTLNSHGGLSSAYLICHTKAAKITGMSASVTTYITRYWELTDNGFTSPNYDISYVYATGDVTGTETNLLPLKKSGATWYKPTGSSFTDGTAQGTGSVNDGTNTLTWTGLTTFSFFGGGGNQAVALPVELYQFDVKKYQESAKINWKTANEIDNDFFILERSIDGVEFTPIAHIKGAGNSTSPLSYFYIDYDFKNTVNYYHLRQVDYNGKEIISETKSVDMSKRDGVIVMTVNAIGQEVDLNYRGVVFDIYSDGSSKKRIQ